MSLLHAARTRVRLLFARRAAESRMAEEFGFHLDMETERLAYAAFVPAVCLLARIVPTRRALRVEPAVAMRVE